MGRGLLPLLEKFQPKLYIEYFSNFLPAISMLDILLLSQVVAVGRPSDLIFVEQGPGYSSKGGGAI